MQHDGQRMKTHDLRAGQKQGHRRSGHVGDRQVGDHGQAAGQAGLAVGVECGFRRAADQPGRQQGRVVGRQQALEALHRTLDLAGGRHDGVHAFERVGDVGAEFDQAHADLVAEFARVAGARLTQGDRHGRNQRLRRHAVMLRQVAAQRGRADPQRHVVKAAANGLAHGLALGQRHRGRDEHPALRDGGVERAFGRQLHWHFWPAAVSLQ